MWVGQSERDHGKHSELEKEERERLKVLERENRELRRTNQTHTKRLCILPKRSSRADASHD